MVNWHQVLILSTFFRARFSYKIFGAKIPNPKASFVVLGAKILYKKCARKTLMKSTPDINPYKLCFPTMFPIFSAEREYV